MHTVNELIAALQDIADDYGDLPIAVAVQPNYPVAGNVKAARITGRDVNEPKLYLFADTTEYGPAFDDGDDEGHVKTVL